jgi:hypothetical protein
VKRIVLIVGWFLLSILAVQLSSFGTAHAGWLDPAWSHRIPVTVSNPGGSQLNYFQVHLSLDSSFDFANAKVDGSDLRFTSDDGTTSIPFWIERWNYGASTASVWINVPSIPTTGATVYLYYGYASASSASNGDVTFDLFDDFESGRTASGYYTLGAAQTALTQQDPVIWEHSAPHTLSVLQDNSGGYTYTGYYGLQGYPPGGGACAVGIGLAYSDDLTTWVKYGSNPLSLNGSPFLNGRWPSVLKIGSTYYMLYEKDFCTNSSIVLATSSDSIHFTDVKTIVTNEPGYANQNPNLFLNPNDGKYYIYWYHGDDSTFWQIRVRSAETPEGLDDTSTETWVLHSNKLLAAPNVFYRDGSYFLSTEALDSSGNLVTNIYSSTFPTYGFNLLLGNPVIADGSACNFQHVIGTNLHDYYCKLTGSTWTVEHRVADLTAVRPQLPVPIPDPRKWTASGGTWTGVIDTQQDASIGGVMQGSIVNARDQLQTLYQKGSDYILEAYGKLLNGRVWGLGVRATDQNNLYSVNLYEDLDSSSNLVIYNWVSGTANLLASTELGPVDTNTWYKLSVKTHGNTIDVYKNDVFSLQTNSNQYATGASALFGEQDTVAEFNNVIVRKYASTEPTASTGTRVSFSGLSSPTITYGNTSITLSGKISGGSQIPTGSVVITLNGVTQSGVIDGSGNFSSIFSLSDLGAGSYTINYSFPGDANYSSALGTGTLTVSAKALTVSGAVASNKIYNGNTIATVTSNGSLVGIVGSDDVSLNGTASGAFSDKTVGNGKTVTITGLSITGAKAANYTLTLPITTTANITTRTLTVTATGVNKIYDATTSATVTLSDDHLGTDVVNTAYTGAAFTTKSVGNGKTVNVSGINISGGDASNYTLGNTTATATANITARTLTVTATGVNKIYDATTSATVTLSDDHLGTDVVNITYTGAVFTDMSVGNGKTVNVSGISISGGDTSNYTLGNTTATATANITPSPLTVTADAKSKIYGAADPALTYQITGGALVGSDTITGALSRPAGENVGDYAINQNDLTAGSNYNLTYVGANLSITPAPLTVAADAKSKIYGAADPALTYQITGGALVGSDTITGALSRTAGENVGAYVINQNDLTAGSNYNLTYVGANLTIDPAPLTVTADAKSKIYGAADPALTYQITGGALVGSDTITGSLSRTPGENAGTYVIYQNDLTAGSNYNLNYVGANFTIGKALLTVTAADAGRAYGAANPDFTAIYTGFVNSENSSVLTGSPTLTTTANTSSPVGTYPIVADAGTLAAANYIFSFVSGTLTIGNASQTITFGAMAPRVVGSADFSPAAGASSGLAVTYTSNNELVATIVAGKVHLVGAGSATITAQQSGDSNYNPATDVSQDLQVVASGHTLTVTLASDTTPSGGGSIVFSQSPYADETCSVSPCQRSYPEGANVTVTAQPDSNSLFTSWSGACSGGSCGVAMNGDLSATAAFSYVKPARTSGTPYNYFLTFSDAYYAAITPTSDGVIQARDFVFAESINMTEVKNITIKGGYDLNYSSRTGYSHLKSLTVGKGSVVIDRVLID